MTGNSERQQLLQRRAESLARESRAESADATVDLADFVTLVSSGQRYAIDARHTVRVLSNDKLCRLPAEAGELVALIMIGGESVPVADLASLLGTAAPDRSRPYIVLVDGAGSALGLLADEVESGHASAAEIRPLAAESDDGTPLQRGVTADGAVLLDTARLLADQRLSRFARLPPPAPAPAATHLPKHPGEQ